MLAPDPALAKLSGLSQLPLINGIDTAQLQATAATLGAGNFGLPTIAMFSFGLVTGTEPDRTVEALFQPKIVLHLANSILKCKRAAKVS